MENIKGINVPIQIGFNRRFDSSHAKAQEARVKKEIGELEMVVITSRDPEPPGVDYLKAAGDRKSTRLNSSHSQQSRMPSSA